MSGNPYELSGNLTLKDNSLNAMLARLQPDERKQIKQRVEQLRTADDRRSVVCLLTHLERRLLRRRAAYVLGQTKFVQKRDERNAAAEAASDKGAELWNKIAIKEGYWDRDPRPAFPSKSEVAERVRKKLGLPKERHQLIRKALRHPNDDY